MSKQSKTVEEMKAELDTLLEWFESDVFTVEDAAAKFREASLIAESIETQLLVQKNEITVLKQKFDTAE